MKYVSGPIVFAIALFVSSPAASQTIPKDTCSLVPQPDIDAVLGPGAKVTPIGEEQCQWKLGFGGYEIAVRRANGAREYKDWIELGMPKPAKPLEGVGDEAAVSPVGNVAVFRKGNVAVRVSGSAIPKTAPMTFQQGVIELTKRIAARIK